LVGRQHRAVLELRILQAVPEGRLLLRLAEPASGFPGTMREASTERSQFAFDLHEEFERVLDVTSLHDVVPADALRRRGRPSARIVRAGLPALRPDRAVLHRNRRTQRKLPQACGRRRPSTGLFARSVLRLGPRRVSRRTECRKPLESRLTPRGSDPIDLQRLGMAESLVSSISGRVPPRGEQDSGHPGRATFVRSTRTLGRSALGRRAPRKRPHLRRIDRRDIRTLTREGWRCSSP